MQTISSRTWTMLWNGRIAFDLSIESEPHRSIKRIGHTAELCEINRGVSVVFNADILLTLDVTTVRRLLTRIAARELDLGVHQR
jgi:hypothetical protein